MAEHTSSRREDGPDVDPAATLAQIGRWQGDARARARARWIPLVGFGFVVLLAVPAHLDLSQPAAPGSTSSGGSSGFLGGLLTLVWRTYLTPDRRSPLSAGRWRWSPASG